MRRILPQLLIAICLVGSTQSFAQSADYRLEDKPFTVEYYYKIKWGFFDEFMSLYMKNHWPSIEAAVASGDFLEAKIHRPYNHVGESDRWDLRVTVVCKNALIALGLDNFDMDAENKRLYPDQETWQQEEQRRFELIDEHMDVQIYQVDAIYYQK